MATDEMPQLRMEDPEAPAGRRLKLALGGAVVLLAIGMVWSVPRPTGDLYVGLAAGRDIMAGKLGAVDDWAFTTAGRVWVNQNWGTHMLYYLFYKATGGRDGDVASDEWPGEIGLLILKFLILLVGTVSLIYACRWRGASWPVAMLVSGAVIAAGRSFIDLRPNLTTLMFTPVMLHLIYRTEEHPRRIWLTMAVFGLIWANLHGGFLYGLGAMGFWAACLIAPEVFRERALRKPLMGLVWGAAVALVVYASMIGSSPSRKAKMWAIAAGLAVALVGGIVIAWGMRRAARQKAGAAADIDFSGALRRSFGPRWPYIAATAGAIILAGVVTPFGIHQAFRDYSQLKMSFWEIWNLSHPFVVMASKDADLWQSVIEWHSIFTAEANSFGTTWEFFSLVGLLGALVSMHVLTKLLRRRTVTVEDLVLLAGTVVLGIVVFLRAKPVYQDFGPLVARFRELKARGLPDVLEQQGGWVAAMIVYPLLALAAFSALLAAAGSILTRPKSLEPVTGRHIRRMLFDVFMATAGICLAFDARRFIPLSLILIAPLLARRMQWLLGALSEAWPRIWPWALAAVATGLGVWALAAYAARTDNDLALWFLLAAPVLLVALGLALRCLRPLEPEVLGFRAWPTALAAAGLLALIGVQAYSNALSYCPVSPLVRYRSVLKNMISYSQFPPHCRDFLNDNALGGRVFNEWRWEGYLHWYCPQTRMFVGGRAQQVYDADTYRRQRHLLGEGAASPDLLTRMGVRWLVVPLASYSGFVEVLLYDQNARWAPVFFDGENLVVANAALPEGLAAIEACLARRLKYRDGAMEGLSRGYCLTTSVVARMRSARAPAGTDAKDVRLQANREAIAAFKDAIAARPAAQAYAALADLYRSVPPDLNREADYWETQRLRLSNVDFHRLGGLEVLECRQHILNTLTEFYRLAKRPDLLSRVRQELDRLDEDIKVLDDWR